MQHINSKIGRSVKPALSAPVLGTREIQTLNLFWDNESSSLSATDILSMFERRATEPDEVISINTIQSTIERLWKKKLLTRKKQGKAYIYTCTYSKQEVISSLIKEIGDALGQGDESAIVSGIFTFLKSRNSSSQLDMLNAISDDTALQTQGLLNAN